MNSVIKISTQAFIITILLSTQAEAGATDGIIHLKSKHSVTTTINNLESILKNKGMTIFKRVDHKAGAEKAGLQLRPTELLVFGNPKVGTPLMLCSQTAALDLPQKALAYEDENGQVWLAYNDPVYMANRHNIKECEESINKVSNALATFSKLATGNNLH